MKVSPINQQRLTPGFNGKLIVRGKVTPAIVEALEGSGFLSDLARNHDVIVHSSVKNAKKSDLYHSKGDPLFKLTMSVLKENSITDRIKDFFFLISRSHITRKHHSIDGTISRIKDNQRMSQLTDYWLS